MRRLFILLAAALIVVSGAAAQDKPIVTVLDLKTDSVAESEMKIIISMLSSSLFNTDLYTVIDVAERENLLKEIEYSYSGCTDTQCQIEIGKQLAADRLVVGSIGMVGSRYILSVKLLETSTAATLGAADGTYADLDAMVEDLDNLARRLAGLPPLEPEIAVKERSPFVRALPYIGLGVGVVAGAVGGYFLYDAFDYKGGPVEEAWIAYDTASGTDDFATLYQAYLAEYDVFKGKAILGIAIAGPGLIALVTSAVFAIIPAVKKSETPVAFYVIPGREAALLGCRVRL